MMIRTLVISTFFALGPGNGTAASAAGDTVRFYISSSQSHISTAFINKASAKVRNFAHVGAGLSRYHIAQTAGTSKQTKKRDIVFAGTLDEKNGEWTDLTGEFSDNVSSSPVKKMVLSEGTGDVATKGSEVEINYLGTLASLGEWTCDDVAECWLKNQQGLDHLVPAFLSANIDGPKLLDEEFFNEDFVERTLEVSNKIQRKKIVMAARRLSKQADEFPEGTLFDANADKGPYKFVLGVGKVIRGMDLLVSTMKVGEKARLICRADYGYGAEGLRKMSGEVVVPPFATLCFDIDLISSS